MHAKELNSALDEMRATQQEALIAYCGKKGHMFAPQLVGTDCVVACKICGELQARYLNNKKVCK